MGSVKLLLSNLEAKTEELASVLSSRKYKACWDNPDEKSRFTFSFQDNNIERHYDYDVDVNRSFYLCSGEAKCLVLCVLIMELTELIEKVQLDHERDRRAKHSLKQCRAILAPFTKGRVDLTQIASLISKFDREQRASMLARRLTDKDLQRKLYAQGLGIIKGHKAFLAKKARKTVNAG